MGKAFLTLLFSILIGLRLINLSKVPIFIDEQTYLSLGKSAIENPQTLLISLKYLVFPIVPWILGITQLIFGPFLNVLILGRSLMVLSDLVSAIFIYLITKEMFNKKHAIFSALIYLSIPLNLFHSRIVLLEPITNMFFFAALYFFINRIVKQQTERISIARLFLSITLITILLSLSLLSKPIALISFSALPALLINALIKGKKRNIKNLLNILLPMILIFAMTLLISLPFTWTVWRGFSDYRVSNDLYAILYNLKKNLWLVWWWSKVYLTLPIIAAIFVSFLYALLSKAWNILWVFLWLISAIFLDSSVGKNFLPRHLFLIVPPVALAVGFIFFEISKRYKNLIALLLLIATLLISWKIDAQIIFSPESAPIALEDKQQFFEDWTSGQGLDKVAKSLKTLSQNRKIVALTESDGGFGWALKNIYYIGNTTILESKNLGEANVYLDLPTSLTNTYDNTYLILNRNTEPPATWPIKLISSHPKFSGVRSIKIYQYLGN